MKEVNAMNKKTALRDCKRIWRYMTKNECNKPDAISELFKAGKLSQEKYRCDCPLCEKYANGIAYEHCVDCPWPGKTLCRCISTDSPYAAYCLEKNNKLIPQRIQAVYDLIKTFK